MIFNVLTASVALALLPWLIGALGTAREALGLPPDPAAKLALFHTTFNLLGVVLMWPLADSLTRWLLRRFRAREEDEAQPRYLDDNVLAVPTLALEALEREIERIGHLTVNLARAALAGADGATLARQRLVLARLDAAVESFVERMNRAAMPQGTSERLAWALRVQRYYETMAEQGLAGSALPGLPAGISGDLAVAQANFRERADALLVLCLPRDGSPDAAALASAVDAMEVAYQALKGALLLAGAAGQLSLAAMEEALRRFSALRRAAQQAAKAARRYGLAPSAADQEA